MQEEEQPDLVFRLLGGSHADFTAQQRQFFVQQVEQLKRCAAAMASQQQQPGSEELALVAHDEPDDLEQDLARTMSQNPFSVEEEQEEEIEQVEGEKSEVGKESHRYT
jgi:hypothetical protein